MRSKVRPVMGRRRKTSEKLPLGVRIIRGAYYWRPTSAAERTARRARGERESVRIGATADEARRRWAELTERRPRPAGDPDGTVAELLDRFLEDVIPSARVGLAPATRREYTRQLERLRARWGAWRYARTDVEAARGGYITTLELQRSLDQAEAPISANRELALLSTVFGWARRWGLTFYNPCAGVMRNEEAPRSREVAPWERETLLAVASPAIALMMRWERITGWREADVYTLLRVQLEAAGVALRQGKRGRRQMWSWTPELRAIVDEAKELPGAKESLYVFPADKKKSAGAPLTKWGFQSAWRRTIARANRLLAELGPGAPQIRDLHFHDLRAEAIAEAEELRGDGSRFAGHADPRVTRKHYLRRVQKVEPLE